MTIKKMFSFKDVRSLCTDLQVIKDCDILEDQFKINISQMISKPECNIQTYVQVGNLPQAYYTDGVGSPYEIRDNPLSNPDLTQCFEKSVVVAARVEKNSWLSKQYFKLDPMRCFNSDAKLKLKDGDKNALIVDLTRDVTYNEKLFEKCLTEIRILDENKTDIPFDRVAGFSHLAKITSLDRLKNHTLTVEYKFKWSQVRKIQLFVPESSKEEDNAVLLPAVAAGAGGTFLVLLIVIVICIFCNRKVRGSREEECHTDENHTYGTYARGWDGEGEYGDGDVVEVVDNNELYGGAGEAETRDNNEYYGI